MTQFKKLLFQGEQCREGAKKYNFVSNYDWTLDGLRIEGYNKDQKSSPEGFVLEFKMWKRVDKNRN